MNKTAVILMNLGGPDNLNSVEPFLFNLFYDKAIIRLPNPLRWIIAKIISKSRTKIAKEIYSLIGGASPILKETEKQKEALEKVLSQSGNYKVFICMRHWHPMSKEVVENIKKYDPTHIVFLPLYPQFSTTTTASSIEDLQNAIEQAGIKSQQRTICCYYANEDFIDAHASLINDALNNIDTQNLRILFSAHGLPQKVIDQGDPYQWQVTKTVLAIIQKLKKNNLDYKITYQSKVGPMKWLQPNTEDEIKNASLSQKNIMVIPIAFVSEHVETLVELDIEYAKIAKRHQVKYIRVPTLSDNKIFIKALEHIVLDTTSDNGACINCPKEFVGCICNQR